MRDVLLVAWGLLKILIGLGVVVALAYFFVRLASRRLPVPEGRAGVRVLGHLYLGGRRGLTLVKVGPRVLVLGVTDHAVHLLERITDPAEVAEIEGAVPPALAIPPGLERAGREFGRLLRERLGGPAAGRGHGSGERDDG